jgi:predicted phage tail protein
MKRLLLFGLTILLTACGDMIVTDISTDQVRIIAPAGGTQTNLPQVAFSWEPLEGAEEYRLTVVSPSFAAAERYAVDTLTGAYTFSAELPDGDYQWRVMAINSEYRNNPQAHSFRVQTRRDLSGERVTTLAPAQGMTTAHKTVAFSWEPLAGATGYRVVVVTPDFEQATGFAADTTLQGTSFSAEFANGLYQWQIEAFNAAFRSKTQTGSFRVQTEKDISRERITAISPLNETETNRSEVLFSWDPLVGAERYRLTVASPSFERMEWLAADETLTETLYRLELPDGRYEWRIQALNDAFETEPGTQTFRVRREKDLSKEQVSIVAPAAGSTLSRHEAVFSWDPLAGADRYRLTVASPSFERMEWLAADETLTETQYRLELPDGRYEWRIQALNGSSQTTPASYSFQVETGLDISGRRITVIAPADGVEILRKEVAFSWEPVEGAERYRLTVASPSFARAEWLAEDIVLEETLYRLSLPEGDYQWRIRAINATSQTQAQTCSFRVKPDGDIGGQSVAILAPASGVELTAGTISFNWEPLAGADHYRVVVATPSFAQVQQIVCDQTIATTSLSVDLPVGAYEWRIEALNDNFQSLRRIVPFTVVPVPVPVP